MVYLYDACDQISDFCPQQLLRKMRRKISWTDGRTDIRTEVKQYTPPSPFGERGYNNIPQLVRYSRACDPYHDFLGRGLLSTRKLLNQGFQVVKLKSSLQKLYCHHYVNSTTYMCQKLSRVCSACHNHNPVLSLFMIYHPFCNKSNMMGTTSGAGTVCPSKIPMFLSGDHVFLVFCVKCTAWYYRSMYSGRVSSSCSTSGTCCVNLVTNLRKEVDCESLLDSWKQHVLEFHSREINIYNITWKSMFMLLKNRTEIYM